MMQWKDLNIWIYGRSEDNFMRFRQFYVTISEDFECQLLLNIFNEYINDLSKKGKPLQEVFDLKDKIFRNSVIIEKELDTPF